MEFQRQAGPEVTKCGVSVAMHRAGGAMTVEPSRDITRIMLFVLVVGMLLLGSFWTLLPFLGGLIWATTIVVATWPALVRLQQLTGRRALAIATMTLLVLLAFIAPFVVAIGALLDAARRG